MQLWMCLRNLTNSPMPAANHLLFFPSSGDMEHDWQMIGQHRKSDVQVESNQMTVSGTGVGGGGHRTPVHWRKSCDVEDAFDRTEQSCNTEHNCQRERTNIKWCHFIFYRIELQTPLVLQTDHKTSRHTSITSGLLYVVSAQIMLSWASGSLVKVIVIWYFTYTTVVPLGVRVLISFFFFSFRFPASGARVCEISFSVRLCWHFLSILRIPRLRWYFPNRSVWSEAVWWRRTICHPLRGLDCTCHQPVTASHLEALPN